MNSKGFPVFTAITTALSAIALFILPYSAGLFPGGLFEDAAIGPLPLWTICLALVLSLILVSVGTLVNLLGRSRQP